MTSVLDYLEYLEEFHPTKTGEIVFATTLLDNWNIFE